MRLSSFLSERGMTRAEFAAEVGVHPVTVSKWCSGAMRPRWNFIDAIQRITGGAVTATDFGTAEAAQ
jgi:transcriptional regulator with XRE-family HTH domain